MKKKYLILIFALALIFIPIVSASMYNLGVFKQDECLNISQVCATCSYVNISSVSNNENSNLISNVAMTSFGNGEWRYELCNTSNLGRYDVRGQGDLDSVDSGFSFYFEVTPNGKEFKTQNSISYLGFILIILFTFFLTMYGSGKIKWSNKVNNEGKILTINNFKYVKVLLYSLAYVELMFLFGLSYKVCREADIEGFAQFFNFIYQLFLNLIYPLIIGLIIIVFVIWINNRKLSKRLKLGLGK